MTKQLRVGLVKVDDILFHPHNVRRDLGDLRSLTNSITKYGIMQPVVVEQYGKHLRLRAGHRRVAAAKLAGKSRVPAVIHDEALEEDEWLIQAVQENIERRGLDKEERKRACLALRDLGCTWSGIADLFHVTPNAVRVWVGLKEQNSGDGAKATKAARGRAMRRLATLHPEELDRLIAEELSAVELVAA